MELMRLSPHVATSMFVLSFTSCVHAPPRQLPASANADAFVSESFAQFQFPSEDSNDFTWYVATPTAYEGQPEYYWAISWGVPETRKGKDPNGLDVAVRWRPTGARSGSLLDLIHAGMVSVHTECMACDGPAFTTHDDRSVHAEVINGRVTITIRGANAVARILPTLPDSVWMSRSAHDDSGEVDWRVAVRRSRRKANAR
jgi:hypothetical protein